MLSFTDIVVVLLINLIATPLVVYFLLGNRVVKAIKQVMKGYKGQMAKSPQGKGSNSGNPLEGILGMIPPEVIGGLIKSFLAPKPPPQGGMTTKP